MNLSLKVVSALLLVLLTAMAISGWVSVTKERDVLNDLLQNHGQSLSNTIGVVCIEPLLSEDYPVLNTFLETTGRERDDILSIEVMQNGKIVSRYIAGAEDLADRVIFNSDVLIAMQTDQPPIKLGEIRLGLSDRQNREIIASRMRELITNTVILFILLSGTLMLALRKIVLEKIRHLSDHARRIAAGNFDLKIDIRSGDELGNLADTFNDMVGTIKHYQEHLEALVRERTRELEEAQEELVNKAMEAGRAQLAAMVLHNIGNAMTPVNVQVESLKANQSAQVLEYLEKCYQELNEHSGDLEHFIHEDQRGREVFGFLGELIKAAKEEREQNADAVDKIDRSIAYVAEILTLQQTYAGGEEENKKRVDLNSLIDDAMRMQMGALERKGITVERTLDVNLPQLLIDKNRLMQVIINLLKNSIEALEKSEFARRKKMIRIKTFAKNGSVGFEITDNGFGLGPQEIDHILEFGKSHRGSSGFGLYYCKRFVEDNHGILNINRPRKGKGTTVMVKFEKQSLAAV
jgi:signal transduction histidine kinase